MNLASFQKVVKVALLVFLLVLVLGVSIFLGKNASSFLAKASSCQLTDVSASQVTSNGAVISWKTDKPSRGKVIYGTKADDLTISTIEPSTDTDHNVPLTLLTPNTGYFYLIEIGGEKCDSSGKKCTDDCTPWSFVTSGAGQRRSSPTVRPTITSSSAITPTSANIPKSASSGSSSSSFCQKVKENIGVSKNDSVKWETAKQYDVDNNGIINALDAIKCQ